MSKICFSADHHIKLGQKNVPRDWQRNRFMLLADELNKIDCDYHVFGGDLLDVANPSIEEVGLMYTFLHKIAKPIIMISGNHEMSTKTLDCYKHISDMLEHLNVRVVREFETINGIDYIPYNILHSKTWGTRCSDLAVTHVRGEIPPHVMPEVNLERFDEYTKVFAGDLHSVSNSQRNILYPGSPFATSFHRAIPSGSNGYFIIDTTTNDHIWHELRLPQLIRQTVREEKEIIKTEFHHTIYELEGDLEGLAKVENSELLDKKITKDISSPATLTMSGSITEELAEFLVEIRDIKPDEVPEYITLFKETILDTD
jgi:DNA repair exonuclease SbcCD nuclease subunit